ncbi:MAG: efflux RND transporter periplasmic adaptor subunit [Bacillota bacterium]
MKRLSIGLAGLLLMVLLAACNQEEDKKQGEERVTPVETEEATEGDIVIDKTVYGRTQPLTSTPIMVQNPGEVDTLEVENGDQVNEGDLIATIKTPAGKQNIRASRDGEIAQLSLGKGEIVSTENPLALIVDLEKIKLQFTVTNDIRSLLDKEDKLTTIINDKEYKAKVTSIGTIPDDTGLYPIEATIENKDNDLLPGMTGKLHIPEKRIDSAVIVPTEAIAEENDESFVYVIRDNKAVRTIVSIKESQSNQTAIKGDVKAGDQIVVNGQLTLTDGSKVNVVKGE